MQQATHYLLQLAEYRKVIDPLEVTVTQIRQALYAFMGVKEPVAIEEQIKKSPMPSMTVPKGAIEAWEKAGRPSPASKWLADYAKQVKHG